MSVEKKQEKKRYSREQRIEIGRLVECGVITRAQAADEYGVADSTVRNYVKLYRDSMTEVPAQTESVQAEEDIAGERRQDIDTRQTKEVPSDETKSEDEAEKTENDVQNGKPRSGKIIKAAAALLLFVLAAGAWLYTRPRFHDVEVELGTQSISISEFMTWIADGSAVRFVTDPATIDITKVGSTQIVLAQGKREETVLLSVVDTTPPVMVMKERVESSLSGRPAPEDFIEIIEDMSEVTLSFETPLEEVSEYGEHEVIVIATDACGNAARGTSVVSYQWLRKELIVEYGTLITKEDILLEPEFGDDLVSQKEIDALNKADLGEYSLKSSYNGTESICRIVIQDTTPPVLLLRDVRIILTQTASMSSFIVEASDNYGDVKLSMPTVLDLDTLGVQNVTIEARDRNGNVTVGHCRLTVKEDDIAPVFSGLKDMEVEKHSSPDYEKGVSATDNIDGPVSFTVDASDVDLDKAGTYYVKYYASDKKGNQCTARRKVTVKHDDEDTRELVDALYASIPDKSPGGLAAYLYNYITYSTGSYGDGEPVWFGLTKRKGNCYVYAHVMKELLSRAGYSSYIIYTKDRSHYWNIVKIGGTWWHVDATPLRGDPKLIMNDAEKYAYVTSRGWDDWDREKWPECNG